MFIAVFSRSNIPPDQIANAVAAIQKQVKQDFFRSWGLDAAIAYSPDGNIAPGWLRVGIVDEIDFPGINGLHAVQNDQPMAMVRATDFWTIDLSHEILEMLVDPFGSYLVPGASLLEGQGQVEYLVEACDPCQDFNDSYFVDGVRVSNFCTRDYYFPGNPLNANYSMPNAAGQPVITGALGIQPGGYLTWQTVDGGWFRASRFDGGPAQFHQIDPPTVNFSTLRAAVDACTERELERRRNKQLKELGNIDLFDSQMFEARVKRRHALSDHLKRLSKNAQRWRRSREVGTLSRPYKQPKA